MGRKIQNKIQKKCHSILFHRDPFTRYRVEAGMLDKRKGRWPEK